MIQGYIKHDIELIENIMKSKDPLNRDQRIGVAKCGLRMIATLGMAYGVFSTLNALRFIATETSSAIFKMAIGATIFALNHDVFIMSEKLVDRLVISVHFEAILGEKIGKKMSEAKDILDKLSGQPMTAKTFFRPLWNMAFTGQ